MDSGDTDTGVDIPAKVLKYEEFLNERLRPDLKQALDAESAIANDIANCEQVSVFLKQVLKKEFTDDSKLKVLTDIGCNFYTEAVIEETDRVNVYLGLGLYLDMGTEEAIAFIGKRQQQLQTKRQMLTERTNSIQAHIKLVYQGLRELQNITADPLK